MTGFAKFLLPLALLPTLTLLPALALSQPAGGMSQEQMRMLMQGAAQIQACLANVDQSKLEEMGKKAEAVQAEVKQMCVNGERDQAQARAIAFGREFAESDDLKQLSMCGEIAKAMIPQIIAYAEANESNPEGSTHVCDNL